MTDDVIFERPRSIEEIARYLGSTEKFIRTKIDRGELKARRLSPRLIRVMPGDLRRWLEASATM
jgi:excisionase family DNA binding protein